MSKRKHIAIGRTYAYVPGHYHFPRVQSREMAALPWAQPKSLFARFVAWLAGETL